MAAFLPGRRCLLYTCIYVFYSSVVDLQCCVSFRGTPWWSSYTYTCIDLFYWSFVDLQHSVSFRGTPQWSSYTYMCIYLLYWSFVDLQCCVSFRDTRLWASYPYMWIYLLDWRFVDLQCCLPFRCTSQWSIYAYVDSVTRALLWGFITGCWDLSRETERVCECVLRGTRVLSLVFPEAFSFDVSNVFQQGIIIHTQGEPPCVW